MTNGAAQYMLRLTRLIFGLFLYALAIVITLRANIGYAPWDVFHAGLSKLLGISFGTASIVVGLVIVAAAALLGEKLGLGTILNMILIGVFIDIILGLSIIPLVSGIAAGVAVLTAGLFVMALATYFYIGSGFGAGPRDSLMVALTRITKLPVGVCRGAIELAALGTGWLLGGLAGVGTVISAFAIGFCIQITFRLLKFDPKSVTHETVRATLSAVKTFVNSGKSSNSAENRDNKTA